MKVLRKCSKGHEYFKSSDCPTSPICETERKPKSGFLSLIPAPARRALESANVKTLEELSNWSEIEILKLHGIGKTAIPILRKALNEEKLDFKTN